MRISVNTDMSITTINKSSDSNAPTAERVVKHGSDTTIKISTSKVEQVQELNNDEETRVKVQEAVEKMNKMLEVNQSSAKFKYHEGLERYYVTVVNSNTDEIVKEIPPKKLLDAFYEMQKLFGMIVDEKI